MAGRSVGRSVGRTAQLAVACWTGRRRARPCRAGRASIRQSVSHGTPGQTISGSGGTGKRDRHTACQQRIINCSGRPLVAPYRRRRRLRLLPVEAMLLARSTRLDSPHRITAIIRRLSTGQAEPSRAGARLFNRLNAKSATHRANTH